MESLSTLLCFLRPIYSILTKIRCNSGSLSAIVIPRFSGKSTFVSTVCSKEYLLLDIESNIQLSLTEEEKSRLNSLVGNSSFNLHFYPLAKAYLTNIQQNHKNRKIIVVSSDLELVKYLGIKYILAYVPTNTLGDAVKANLSEEQKAIYEQSRIDLLINIKQKDISSFTDFQSLTQMIMNKYKLSQKL